MINSVKTTHQFFNRKPGHQDPRQKNLNATKEGVLVNNLIKTNECNWANMGIPQKVSLPTDLYSRKEKIAKKWFENPIIPLVVAPLALLGMGAGVSKIFKSSFLAKTTIPKKDQLRSIGRIVTINDDNNMVLYLLSQDPSLKSMLAAASVLTASAGAFIAKNVIEGIKEVCVKKEKADIRRDLEEKLIEIETRSFSGKNKILRNIVAKSSKELKQIQNKVSFSGSEKINKDLFTKFMNKPNFTQNPEKKTNSNKNWLMAAAGIGSLLVCGLLTKNIFKNLSSVGKHIEKVSKEASEEIQKGLSKLSKDDIQKTLTKSKMNDELKSAVYKEWKKANGEDFIFDATPELMGGKENKVSFLSAVSDITAFIYTYVVNPTPQTRNLMFLMLSSASLGYLGKTTVEGVKEVQVEKANAKTEVELQDRLVNVELNNFMAKKQSFVTPIIEDFKRQAQVNPDKTFLDKAAETALFEIKTGPPFVYS